MVTNKTIEEYILESLKEGGLSIESLIASVAKKRARVTRQGVYRTLRVLKKREIVTIHNKVVSLSAIWIGKMQNYFTLVAHYYSRPTNDSSFLNLCEGDKSSYSFRTLVDLDIFWSHALYLFLEVLKNSEPLYIYNPHDWAYFVRKESDEVLVEKSFKGNHQILVAVGHSEPLDKLVKRNFDGTQGQYYLANERFGFKENYYCNVIGDYCIEGFLDKRLIEELDNIYKTRTRFDEITKKEFEKICLMQGKNRLVISRNKKRADRFKGIMNKYFYIKGGGTKSLM